MAVHNQKTFANQEVVLDGNEFHGCELRHCNLIYKAQDVVKLEHCHLVGCTWQFEDAALRTVTMLKGLYRTGRAGKEVVEAIFQQV
jgi:hypothetical protein